MFAHTFIQRLPAMEALEAYRRLRAADPASPAFILESRSVHETYGRFSLVGAGPLLELTGRGAEVAVRLLHPAGEAAFTVLRDRFAANVQAQSADWLKLSIPKGTAPVDEAKRFERICAAQVIPTLLEAFQTSGKTFAGLYGALGYNFVAQFEDLDLPADETPDFRLALYDTLLLVNHLTGEVAVHAAAANEAAAQDRAAQLVVALSTAPVAMDAPLVSNLSITPDPATYMDHVREAVALCDAGELLEIVLSRTLAAQIEGDALALYAAYRDFNPAPYLFYFDFGDEQLCGASPEMMLRVEDGRATLRPISGSAPRGSNAVEDHARMLALLNSPKEKSELDMLVDLGRNDLARVCNPGVRLDDYRVVEKYARVMHTVAQVSGQLQEQYSGFDALVATLNAGTLTGAPKLAAMQHLARIENKARGYYGGVIGYLSFSGDVNTGITIRTAHIRNGELRYTAGATLLVESDPAAELDEVDIKTAAFRKVLEPFVN